MPLTLYRHAAQCEAYPAGNRLVSRGKKAKNWPRKTTNSLNSEHWIRAFSLFCGCIWYFSPRHFTCLQARCIAQALRVIRNLRIPSGKTGVREQAASRTDLSGPRVLASCKRSGGARERSNYLILNCRPIAEKALCWGRRSKNPLSSTAGR